MFQNTINCKFSFILTFATLALVAGGKAWAVGVAEPACIDADTVHVNTTSRDYDHRADSRVFRVYVPDAGVLSLRAAAPDPSGAETKIRFLGTSCESGDSFRHLFRSISAAVVEVHLPGTYFFHVAGQDPAEPLGHYRVDVGFVDAERFAQERRSLVSAALGLAGFDADETPPEEDPDATAEADPPPLIFPGPGGLNASTTNRMSGEGSEEDPDATAEADPPPLILPGFETCSDPSWLLAELAAACAFDELGTDDALFCAHSLAPGETRAAEIYNGFGDDLDAYSFVLSSRRTVEIRTAGGTDTRGALYDRFGHRLASDDDSGTDANFRIVKTLAPGRYFVRVGGEEGLYELGLESLGW